MSEFAETVESGIMFVLGVGDSTALLDEENARLLRDDLNKFLGADKQLWTEPKWRVGDVIKVGAEEPDLPVGSVIQDDSTYHDTAVKTEDGWQWRTMLGGRSDDEFKWSSWNDMNWKVIEVGGS